MSGSTCHRMNTLNLYINRCRLSSNCPYFICIFHPPFWTHRINYKRFLMDRCYLKKKEWSKIQQKLEINLGVFFLFKQFWKDCSSSFVHHSEPFHSQDLISNSPFRLLYNSYDVSSDNLLLDQLLIPLLTFVFFLITCLLDIVLIS